MIRTAHEDLAFLADAASARDLRRLYDLRIQAVVDLAVEEPPATLGRDLIYCRFPLHDDGSNSPELIATAVETVHMLFVRQIRTLVCCSGGMSRSPVITAAALARLTGGSLEDCLVHLTDGGPRDVSPALLASVRAATAQR
ncbi:dual specificity protein phosphatase family protein [Alienimonas californiensis]|uniref:Dual specificity phosphatase, catalytic domain n=1 Tax=Alienimonas californiensis TaxID=2527989 RepID=A0A517P6X9_9PLAN|nr:dual specificity protein phosphatase [Alienimonas californiensis]QDT15138.1 Dual specificity phosphatase, catalytic domain [Alienimonas californiensis]